METKIPLSVAIIVQDKAQNLPDCLKSVAFAEQIVVVDSGSTDDTVRIASDFGCDVFVESWRGGFGAQKQFAVDQCRYPWILVLDADERIPPETASKIKQIISNTDITAAGFSFPRKNFFQGRWIKHAGWWPDRIVRIFRKDMGRMTTATVHEAIEINGPIEALDVPIEHFTESRIRSILLKIDQYSTLGAEEAFKEGKTASIWSAAIRAKLTFFQNYFLRLGCLDGSQGFTLAITDAINKFFKYAKLAEMNKQFKKRKF
ncbi:MAG: glycosyltransferase family 2 protein [Deltaproteobacteria bacterium]|nr:glycosyltransferase family 2 protein [Deltaproteobacteria bacterium]